MREGGYIKVWRKMLDSEVMKSDWLCRLWMWCLLKAQWKESKDMPRGTFTTTRIRGSEELNVTGSRFYEGLNKLCELGCIELRSNNKATTISVCNYEVYQEKDDEKPEVATTKQQQSNNKATTYLIEEELEEGKKATGAGFSASSTLTAQSPSDDTYSPGWLARKWVFSRRGTQGRNELDRARSTFEEMIRLGCLAAQIAAEIDSSDRRRTEPVWEFEERVLKAAGLWKGNTPASRNGKITLTKAVQDGIDWVQEHAANDAK